MAGVGFDPGDRFAKCAVVAARHRIAAELEVRDVPGFDPDVRRSLDVQAVDVDVARRRQLEPADVAADADHRLFGERELPAVQPLVSLEQDPAVANLEAARVRGDRVRRGGALEVDRNDVVGVYHRLARSEQQRLLQDAALADRVLRRGEPVALIGPGGER